MGPVSAYAASLAIVVAVVLATVVAERRLGPAPLVIVLPVFGVFFALLLPAIVLRSH